MELLQIKLDNRYVVWKSSCFSIRFLCSINVERNSQGLRPRRRIQSGGVPAGPGDPPPGLEGSAASRKHPGGRCARRGTRGASGYVTSSPLLQRLIKQQPSTSDAPMKPQRRLFLQIKSKNTATHFRSFRNRAGVRLACRRCRPCGSGLSRCDTVSILGVKVNHLGGGAQTPTPLPSVLLKARRCVWEGGTLERQVFVTQGGEALLHHLRGHFLQRGGVPLGTVVLVYQHCGR